MKTKFLNFIKAGWQETKPFLVLATMAFVAGYAFMQGVQKAFQVLGMSALLITTPVEESTAPDPAAPPPPEKSHYMEGNTPA